MLKFRMLHKLGCAERYPSECQILGFVFYSRVNAFMTYILSYSSGGLIDVQRQSIVSYRTLLCLSSAFI